MENHTTLSDVIFIQKFRDLSFDPALFSHEAHLRLAWIYIHNYGIESALKNIPTQIKAFAALHGDSEKYNLTVTVASIRAVSHFYSQSTSKSFKYFIEEFPQLKSKFKKLLQSHYSIDIFSSEMAKTRFIHPDKAPF